MSGLGRTSRKAGTVDQPTPTDEREFPVSRLAVVSTLQRRCWLRARCVSSHTMPTMCVRVRRCYKRRLCPRNDPTTSPRQIPASYVAWKDLFAWELCCYFAVESLSAGIMGRRRKTLSLAASSVDLAIAKYGDEKSLCSAFRTYSCISNTHSLFFSNYKLKIVFASKYF